MRAFIGFAAMSDLLVTARFSMSVKRHAFSKKGLSGRRHGLDCARSNR
jgi:hypothetical protein